MKQYPSSLKFKKNHKLNSSFYKNYEKKVFFPSKAEFALQSLEPGKILYKHIEACRKSVRRAIKKKGIFFIRIFTFLSITKKPLAVRMGKGKGNHAFWAAPIKKGQIICELNTSYAPLSYNALRKAKTKLPLKTKIVRLTF